MHPSKTLITLQHPLASQQLARLRNRQTTQADFKQALETLSMMLMMEATRDLAEKTVLVETPLCTASVTVPDEAQTLYLCPILRAGLGMLEAAQQLLPTAKVYHLGLYRNEETLKPVAYYSKLPKLRSGDHHHDNTHRVWVLDPMLATGGSAIAALETLKQHGFAEEALRLVCLLAAPEGLQAVHAAFSSVQVVTACVDERLNDIGYIVPGLGDAGDRLFGT